MYFSLNISPPSYIMRYLTSSIGAEHRPGHRRYTRIIWVFQPVTPSKHLHSFDLYKMKKTLFRRKNNRGKRNNRNWQYSMSPTGIPDYHD